MVAEDLCCLALGEVGLEVLHSLRGEVVEQVGVVIVRDVVESTSPLTM
jgi:hypothetical protein